MAALAQNVPNRRPKRPQCARPAPARQRCLRTTHDAPHGFPFLNIQVNLPSPRLATAGDLTPEWITAVARPIALNGQAYDLAPDALSLRVQSINTGRWMPLNLPTNGHLFATVQDARAAYTAIFVQITRLQLL